MPRPSSLLVGTSVAALACAVFIPVSAEQAVPTPQAPAETPRPAFPGPVLPVAPEGPGGRGRGLPVPISEDDAGFQALFDGKTLNGWDGNPALWRVEGGVIMGETKADTVLQRNTFLIWKGGPVRDFELKLEVQLSGDLATANTGVIYRGVPAGDQWSIKGYQADMDLMGYYSGNLHGERDCPCQMAPRGQFSRADPQGNIRLVGRISDPDALRGQLNIGGWNRYHLIVRGNVHVLIMNGFVTALFISDEANSRWATEGMLGLQLHNGPSERVMFRNVLYRKY